MSEIKLLPCPFCGGEARLQKMSHKRGYYVICKKCGCKTPYFQHQYSAKEILQGEAISRWNTRKSMERIIKRICNVRNNTPNTDFKNGCNASLHQIHREIDIDVKEEGGIE